MTKAEIIRARKNAYNLGYNRQSIAGSCPIENPYNIGARSKTDRAFARGSIDCQKGLPANNSVVENI